MDKSRAGFTGNSAGSTGGASKADLERGYTLPKENDDDSPDRPLTMNKWFMDDAPEPDLYAIDRDTDKDWEPGKEINL